MSIQGRLLGRKKWYTLDDAARRLSVEYGEEVELEDVVQFVLDGELQPSVYLSMVPAVFKPHPDAPRFVGPKWREQQASLDGIHHLHLTTFAMDAWRMWIQGECPPDDEFFEAMPSLWFVTPLDDESTPYIPCEIDSERPPGIDLYESKRPPDISEWIIARRDLDAFISSPDEQPHTKPAEGEELRALEAFGLLVELYASQHGPDYRNGARPKASRIVQDMLAAVPDDVPSMGDRKLKEHVGAAIKAWEAKKGR